MAAFAAFASASNQMQNRLFGFLHEDQGGSTGGQGENDMGSGGTVISRIDESRREEQRNRAGGIVIWNLNRFDPDTKTKAEWVKKNVPKVYWEGDGVEAYTEMVNREKETVKKLINKKWESHVFVAAMACRVEKAGVGGRGPAIQTTDKGIGEAWAKPLPGKEKLLLSQIMWIYGHSHQDAFLGFYWKTFANQASDEIMAALGVEYDQRISNRTKKAVGCVARYVRQLIGRKRNNCLNKGKNNGLRILFSNPMLQTFQTDPLAENRAATTGIKEWSCVRPHGSINKEDGEYHLGVLQPRDEANPDKAVWLWYKVRRKRVAECWVERQRKLTTLAMQLLA